MSDTEDFPVYQTSVKHGPNDCAMTVVRGYTEKDFDVALKMVVENAPSIREAVEVLRAGSVVGGSFPGTTVVDPPSNSAQTPANPAPTCGPGGEHGYMQWRQGDGWKGWFCPLRKDDLRRCKPRYEGR